MKTPLFENVEGNSFRLNPYHNSIEPTKDLGLVRHLGKEIQTKISGIHPKYPFVVVFHPENYEATEIMSFKTVEAAEDYIDYMDMQHAKLNIYKITLVKTVG